MFEQMFRHLFEILCVSVLRLPLSFVVPSAGVWLLLYAAIPAILRQEVAQTRHISAQDSICSSPSAICSQSAAHCSQISAHAPQVTWCSPDSRSMKSALV